jgi:hypothetical protein
MRPWESLPVPPPDGEADSQGRMDHPIGTAYDPLVAVRLTGEPKPHPAIHDHSRTGLRVNARTCSDPTQ